MVRCGPTRWAPKYCRDWRYAAASVETGQTSATIDQLERIGLYRQRRGLEPLTASEVALASELIREQGTDPVSYVCGLFERHQVVCLGWGVLSQRSGAFFGELIRALVDVGVSSVGVEFACADDQWLLDATVDADEFNSEAAAGAIIRWSLRHGYGFAELVDVLRAAWEVNRAGGSMRLVGLEYDLCFDAVTDNADLTNSEAWPHLRHRGSAGRHMREVLEAEVLAGGDKALVLSRTPHALSRLRRRPHRLWDSFDAEVTPNGVVGAANHLYTTLADRVATVLIHQPLPAWGDWGDWALPADGWLDAVFAQLRAPGAPVGFALRGTDLATLPCTSAADGASLGDWADGWIYLEDDHQRQAPRPLLGAVDEPQLAQARRCSVDGWLRRADVSPADFDAAFAAAAVAAELTWTQVQ